MRKAFLVVAFLVAAPPAHSGNIYERVMPAGSAPRRAVKIPIATASEAKKTVRDLATFRDPDWDALTFAQIAASGADAKTSLTVFDRHPDFGEIGASRYVVGIHPDGHKYIIAGAIEIGVEAIAAHYLRTHGPVSKWYWKPLWIVPQSTSLYEHARAAILNLRNY